MAVDKLVDSTQLDADLTSVANAIRTKGGTSAQLAFPAGFVSAIGDIPSGGGGGQLKKEVGSYTPASNVQIFSVTGLSNPPIAVLVMIHDPNTNATDGVIKALGGLYAYGDSFIVQTNNGGTGYGRDQNNTLIPTWLSNYTIEQDGTTPSAAAMIIATETGFSIRSIANVNYTFKSGYTYDWVAYTYPNS